MPSPAPLPPLAVDPASDPAALRARVHVLEAAQAAWHTEQQPLRLRIQDLEQQLQRRLRPSASPPPVGLLSLFGETPLPSLDAPTDAPTDARPSAARARSGPATPRAHAPGPQPLDPALPREVIALPDPPATARICADTGIPLVPGFTQELEVFAPAFPALQRFVEEVMGPPTDDRTGRRLPRPRAQRHIATRRALVRQRPHRLPHRPCEHRLHDPLRAARPHG